MTSGTPAPPGNSPARPKIQLSARAMAAGARRPAAASASAPTSGAVPTPASSSAVPPPPAAGVPAASTTSSTSAAAAATAASAMGAPPVLPRKYLVVGDGILSPFLALSLRKHGIECDLAHHPVTNGLDRGSIVLPPAATEVMGDAFGIAVPSGSMVSRLLIFDHVGNDMCDLDLHEFREQGESTTFYCTSRPKVEEALLALCRGGPHSCAVLPKPEILPRNGVVPLENGGVRVNFQSGNSVEYAAILTTSRNESLVPHLGLTAADRAARDTNTATIETARASSFRWLEVLVPPLPPVGKYEKRFTPGSQEIVEIVTPREAKMSVRPTTKGTRGYYNVTMIVPESAPDPKARGTSLKQFWDDTIEHWTAGIPGYVSHTLFKPMFTHVQRHFDRERNGVAMRSSRYCLPHWSEADGRIIRLGHAAHQANFDAVDISDAMGFAECYDLADTLSQGGDVEAFLARRRAEAQRQMELHEIITGYSLKERGQARYMASRFGMKIMRRYVRSWRGILKSYVTLIPKSLPK